MQVHPYIIIDFIFNEPRKNYSQTIKETKLQKYLMPKRPKHYIGKANWKPESRLTQTATTKELEK